ncbi:Uncharacterised protein [Bordetella pertussis]|nr:Uncharacterised protein [Bordetella pertussis]CFP59943.1 Uncharacterised protein [Bordetella pertussis]
MSAGGPKYPKMMPRYSCSGYAPWQTLKRSCESGGSPGVSRICPSTPNSQPW